MQPLTETKGWDTAAARMARKAALRLIGILALVGCDSLPAVPAFEPITDPAELFMALTLDHRAINLSTAAPYDTFRLTATPRNGLGDVIRDLPPPEFRSEDTTAVWVSRDGLLQARRAAAGVRVIAELTAEGNVRHADTAYVNVTANPNPPIPATLSITPQTPEEATWPMLSQKAVVGQLFLEQIAGIPVWPVLPLRAFDESGNPITGLAIEYRSLDPRIAEVDPVTGMVTQTLAPGEVGIVARTVAYGVVKTDTAFFTVTLPLVHVVLINDWSAGVPVMDPSEVTIRPGGYVFWVSALSSPVDITFDDPTNIEELTEVCAILGGDFCGGGDIAPIDGSSGDVMDAARGRRFPVPGSYAFRSTLTGLSGRVIVADSLESVWDD